MIGNPQWNSMAWRQAGITGIRGRRTRHGEVSSATSKKKESDITAGRLR